MKKLALYIIVLMISFCACKEPAKDSLKPKVAIGLAAANSTTSVGVETTLIIDNKTHFTGSASLLINSLYSNSKIDFKITETKQNLIIPATFMEQVGMNNYYLMIDQQVVAKAQSEITAGGIVDPIEVFTGPNTIWVNNLQESMVVALPKDQYDNPVADKESVSYSLSMPSGESETRDVAVNKQVAPFILMSENKMGEAYIGISAQGAGAKEQKVTVVSLWPTRVVLNMETVLPYADNRAFMRVKSEVMRDKNDDIIPDGTHVMFRSKMGTEFSSYNAYSIDGVASCYIRNPSRAGSMMIDAVVGGRVESKKISQDFKSNIKEVNYKWEGQKIAIGPITSFLGQYVPDGTKVILKYRNQEIVKETEDGKVDFQIEVNIDFAQLSINDFELKIKKEK